MSTDPVAHATSKNVSASGLFGQNKNGPIKSRFSPNDLAAQANAHGYMLSSLRDRLADHHACCSFTTPVLSP